jgi:hypothetical protein
MNCFFVPSWAISWNELPAPLPVPGQHTVDSAVNVFVHDLYTCHASCPAAKKSPIEKPKLIATDESSSRALLSLLLHNFRVAAGEER